MSETPLLHANSVFQFGSDNWRGAPFNVTVHQLWNYQPSLIREHTDYTILTWLLQNDHFKISLPSNARNQYPRVLYQFPRLSLSISASLRLPLSETYLPSVWGRLRNGVWRRGLYTLLGNGIYVSYITWKKNAESVMVYFGDPIKMSLPQNSRTKNVTDYELFKNIKNFSRENSCTSHDDYK